MILQRQKGFLNLYSFIISLLAVLLLLSYQRALPFIPEVNVLGGVDFFPYCVAVFMGMVASTGRLRSLGGQGRVSLGGALEMAVGQGIYVAGFIFALVFASKDVMMSRLFLGTYLVLLVIVLFFSHLYFPRLLASMLFPGDRRIPMLFIGRKNTLESLNKWIEHKRFLGMPAVGYLDDSGGAGDLALGIPNLGKLDNMAEVLRERNIRQVILLEWVYDPELVERMIRICEVSGCRFLVHNNYGESFARRFIPISEGGYHFLALQQEPLEDPLSRVSKRLLDIAIALPVVLFIIPPLCIWVWIMQRIQAPGPLFFIRPRGGQDWREFKMLKFRSMKIGDGGDKLLNQQAQQGDPRVYKFGAFLRKSSLDEFPQFLNVLKGEMSIVGPRPHLIQHDKEFCQVSQSYRIRSLVKPGLTGLAQINGFRGEITDPERLHKRVYWDLYYVNHWSIWMDLKIILKTAKEVVFPPKTAY